MVRRCWASWGEVGCEFDGRGWRRRRGIGDVSLSGWHGGGRRWTFLRGVGLAGEGHGGDALPEGVAGGGVAGEGERVEGDVDAGKDVEVGGAGTLADEGEAILGDMVLGE